MAKINGKNSSTAAEVEDFLSLFPDTKRNQLVVHILGIDIPVLGIFRGCSAKIKIVALVYGS